VPTTRKPKKTAEERLADLHARLGSDSEAEFRSARRLLLTAINKKEQERQWSSLTQAIADGHIELKSGDDVVGTESIYDILPNDAATILALHDLIGADDVAIAVEAWTQIKNLLHDANRSWNDLTNLMLTGIKPNLLDEIVGTFKEFMTFRRPLHDPVAAALWNIHTHCYDQFSHTPRFGAFSYEQESGKSQLVTGLFARLANHPKKYVADKHIAASLYWVLDSERPTILLDEAQNTEIVGTLKTIINAFEAEAGTISRRQGPHGSVIEYNLYAPFAFCWNLSTASSILPPDVLSRCIQMHFDRDPKPRKEGLSDKNEEQKARFKKLKERIEDFVAKAKFNPEPDMPPQLLKGSARYRDCWRPLLSIADALHRGKIAREAAIAMASQKMHESARIRLLRDIRKVFFITKAKTCTPGMLLQWLHDLEECSLEDGESWSFWRGENRTRAPHPLSKTEMFAMLHTFTILGVARLVTKTIRIVGQENPDRGYTIEQFLPYWEKFCPDETVSFTVPESSHISPTGTSTKEQDDDNQDQRRDHNAR
jgi:hypothetical protein